MQAESDLLLTDVLEADSLQIDGSASVLDAVTSPQAAQKTLTWSVVADGAPVPGVKGEASGPSTLMATFDAACGSREPWVTIVAEAIESWDAIAGVNLVYLPTDDGAMQYYSPAAPGVRGDIRIAGHFIDGPGKIVAIGTYPAHSDITLDVSEPAFLACDLDVLRAAVVHEVGHALGLTHFYGPTGISVMGQTLNVGNLWPRFDDIRRAQSIYGDPLEPNNAIETASDVGALPNFSKIVSVSIQNAADQDLFKFTVDAGKQLTVQLVPDGEPYLRGDSSNAVQLFDPRNQNDLSLQILDASGSVLASANSNPAGAIETIENLSLPAAGNYFVRIIGSGNATQMFRLELGLGDVNVPPADFVVNTFADTPDAIPGDGKAGDSNGNVSLRAAVMEANALLGHQTIVLGAGVYLLSTEGRDENYGATGDLDFTDAVTILGAGSDATIIDANHIDRALDLFADAVISNLTITRGSASSSYPACCNWVYEGGGGLKIDYLASTVVIDHVVFSNNDTEAVGGAILALDANVDILNSSFVDNTAQYGGALSLRNGEVAVEGSTFLRNQANHGGAIGNASKTRISRSTFEGNRGGDLGSGGGGAILNFDADNAELEIVDSSLSNNDGRGGSAISSSARTLTTIIGSTINGNTSSQDGWSDALFFYGPVKIENSTISGNSGNGLVANGGDVTVESSTITGNNIGLLSYGGVALVKNTVVVGNTSQDALGNFTSLGNNLIGVVGVATGFSESLADRFGTSAAPLDAMLGPLKDNGGATFTHALFSGSPAIDAGASPNSPGTDQRGVSRSFNVPDIGAYEFNGTDLGPPNNSAAIAADFNGSSLLANAVNLANANAGEATEILLGAGMFAMPDSLTITGNVTIRGTGVGQTILDAGDLHRIFDVRSGAVLNLEGMTLTNGRADKGGAIRSEFGRVNLTDVEINDSRADVSGGAIDASGGTLELNRVNIRGCSAVQGGGIHVWFATVTAQDSVIEGCSATNGGGLYLFRSDVEFLRTSISNNTAVFALGGSWTVQISGWDDVVTFTDGEFSGNQAQQHGGAVHADNVEMTFVNCDFDNNVVAIWGGAINNYALLTVRDCRFTNNSADLGGAIHNKWSNDSIIQSSSFTQNSARYGGAVFNWSNDAAPWEIGPLTKLTVSDSIFVENHATQRGGGIVNDNGILVSRRNRFISNTSDGEGGAYWHANATLDSLDDVFTGSVATRDGGNLYFSQWTVRGSAKLENVTVEYGVSTQMAAGGIYHHPSSTITVLLVNGTVLNNQDAFGSPDIFGRVEMTASMPEVPSNNGPTLDVISDRMPVMFGAGEQTVDLAGIGGSQPLFVTATSDNPALVSQLDVRYEGGEATGQIVFTPNPGASGAANVAVEVRDVDGVTKTRSFTVVVVNGFVVEAESGTGGPIMQRSEASGDRDRRAG
ncbi:MAG: pre-peptidase C-terminal domain-containing protein, partial [Planctomycetia bacterium]|nr:pre-peptidase C-terminal domain-containing protein [Planctomycetia bacterium]